MDQLVRAEACAVPADAEVREDARAGRRGHRRGGRSLSLLFPAEDGCNNGDGAPPNNCRAYFALDGDSDCSSFSDSDSDALDEGEIADLACEGLELNDLYSFDAGRVAAALRNGASFAELRDTIQEALTDAFENRLQEEMLAPEQEAVGDAAAAAATTAATAADPEPSNLAEDLSGRMTPGRATPPEGSVANAAANPDLLTTAANAAIMAREAAGRRRSCLRASRSSIAGSRSSMAGARRRVSLSRATEVVGLVKLDGINAPGSKAAHGLEFVQNAIEEARHRHRRSISNVMKQLGVQSSDGLVQAETPISTCSTRSNVTDEALSAAASAPEPEDELSGLLRERIKGAMAGALTRQKQRQAEAEAEEAAANARMRHKCLSGQPQAAAAAAAHEFQMHGGGCWFSFPMILLPFGWAAPYAWGMPGPCR